MSTRITEAMVEAALAAWHGTPVKNGDERPAMRNALDAAIEAALSAGPGEAEGGRDETWKPVVGWTSYEVSSHGRVRSIDRQAPNGGDRTYAVEGRILTNRLKHGGYHVVTLRAGKTTRSTALVHRLVASAFIPNPDGKPCINHIDCNPSNNRIDNLEWCTQAENLAYMHSLGRGRGPTGQRPPVAKLTDAQVRQIRIEYAGGAKSHQDIATQFNISKRSVGRILLGKAYADVR